MTRTMNAKTVIVAVIASIQVIVTTAGAQQVGRAAAEVRTPVAEHGLLKIADGKLCSASGQPVQLKGMSLFWSQWAGNWYTAATVESLAEQWGCTLCDTPQKLGAPLRWIRHSKLETNHVEETSDFFGGV